MLHTIIFQNQATELKIVVFKLNFTKNLNVNFKKKKSSKNLGEIKFEFSKHKIKNKIIVFCFCFFRVVLPLKNPI